MKNSLSIIFIFVFAMAAYGQTNECTYTISKSVEYVSAQEDVYRITLTTMDGCHTIIKSNNDFIEIADYGIPIIIPGQPVNRSILYRVYTNTGKSRTGTITVNDQTLTVNQGSGVKSKKRVRFAEPTTP